MERLYVYQALTSRRSIRLLRLLPSMDASEAHQGQLFECSLEDVPEQEFTYEALSYAWGDPETSYVIKIDGLDLPVTANLHAALKRLREKRRMRLLWIDALCIDQRNDEEKEHQIQLMYQIYACASCVIVWLGEENDESDQALEDLRTIGKRDKEFEDQHGLGVKKYTTSEKNDPIIERIGKLFQRAWFRRIWVSRQVFRHNFLVLSCYLFLLEAFRLVVDRCMQVLQEVGAARRVQVRCGNAALDGHAFALAASRLHGSFRESQALQRKIRSTAHLIKGSILRPAYQAAEAPFERVGSLGELVDMFHDREATVPQDKIYALLGISSDAMSQSGILPDYSVTRGQLFQSMVEFVMSDKISVECQNDKEVAVVKARGNVLGYISHIGEDSMSGNTQTISVEWSDGVQDIGHDKGGHNASLMIQAPATPLKLDDILCILDGAKALTIIRLHQDFSVIVSAATTPRDMDWPTRLESLEQSELPVHDLVLIWDWNYHPDSYCRWREYESWTKANDWVPEGPSFVAVHRPDVLSRQGELVLICLETLGSRYSKDRLDHAKERLVGLLSSLDAALQAEEQELQMTARHILSVLLFSVAGRSPDDSDSNQPRQALQQGGNRTNRTSMLLYWTMEKRCKILPRIIMESGCLDINGYGSRVMTVASACGYLDVVDLLLKEGAEVNKQHAFHDSNPPELKSSIIPDRWEMTALQAAARAGSLEVVERLLRENADVNFPSGESDGRTALQAAAEGGHVSVVERLLEENADVNAPTSGLYGLTALQAAAGAGCMAILERLIQEGADVNGEPCQRGGRTALQKAAEAGHLPVVKRLLQENAFVNAPAGQHRGRTALQAASERGHESIVELLLHEKADVDAPAAAEFGRTALEAASEGGHLAIVELLLEAEADVNKRYGNWNTPLEYASHRGHDAVVERLKEAGAI